MQQKPSVGRQVHYQPEESAEPQAATITRVYSDFTVALTVLPPNAPPYTRDSVSCGPNALEPAKGCWNWPLRS